MELPPFLKNYTLAFFGMPFIPFIVPSMLITPPYIAWMCYLGSFCTNLVKDADKHAKKQQNKNLKYVLGAIGLIATLFIFVYLMWYTKKMIRDIEDEAKASIDMEMGEIE